MQEEPTKNTGPRGLFNITSTPLSIVHQVANLTDSIPPDEPRTKSDRSTKVYIGKIPQGISDYFMEQMFLECGPVSCWRRMLDSSGKPLPYGFADFYTVEGMLRCLRLLNGLFLKNCKLVCRIDLQTEFFIKEWADLKRAEWERKRWDNLLTEEQASRTWEEEALKDDSQVSYNIQLLIHNLEQNVAEEALETDEEHPREKERERRIKSRQKERERQFRDKEREWLRREDIKERERTRDSEREEDRQREKVKMLRKDLDYDSDDNEVRRKKYSKKLRRKREERLQLREKEKEDDAEDARREFELLNPGVATADEKLRQAKELEEKLIPENLHEYTLREHKDLEISISKTEEFKTAPRNKYFQVEQEEEPLYKTTHKPLALPDAPEEITVPKAPQEITMTQTDFETQLQTMKRLLEKVPRRRSDLYEYPLDWTVLVQNRVMEKRLLPFISKLLKEYLGEADRSIAQSVVKLIANREEPQKIEKKVSYLDEDASVFVKRIWRMLIFEDLKIKNI